MSLLTQTVCQTKNHFGISQNQSNSNLPVRNQTKRKQFDSNGVCNVPIIEIDLRKSKSKHLCRIESKVNPPMKFTSKNRDKFDFHFDDLSDWRKEKRESGRLADDLVKEKSERWKEKFR